MVYYVVCMFMILDVLETASLSLSLTHTHTHMCTHTFHRQREDVVSYNNITVLNTYFGAVISTYNSQLYVVC